MERYEVLSLAPLFRGMNPGGIRMTMDGIHHRYIKVRAGSLIAQSGEPVKSLMIVVSGVVKGEMIDYAGRVIKIEDIPAPGALASAFIFGSRNRFPVNVIAITDSELLVIEKSDFLSLMMRDSVILINFLDMVSNRSQFLSEKIKFLNFKTIKGKLAHLILQRETAGAGIVRLGMTQSEIADFFGVARPSVARALAELEAEGYILSGNKEIRIVDRKGLSSLTSD